MQDCSTTKKQVSNNPIQTISLNNLIINCVPYGNNLIVSTDKELFQFVPLVGLRSLSSKEIDLLNPIILGSYNNNVLFLNQEENYYKILEMKLTEEGIIEEITKDKVIKIPTSEYGVLNINFSDDYVYYDNPSFSEDYVYYVNPFISESLKKSKIVCNINIYNIKEGSLKEIAPENNIAFKLNEDKGILYASFFSPYKLVAIDIQSGKILWEFELDPSKENLTFINGIDFEIFNDNVYFIYRAIPRISGDSRGVFGIKILDRLNGTEKANLKYYTKLGFGKSAPNSNLFWSMENFFAEVYGYGELSAITKDTHEITWTTNLESPLVDLLSISEKQVIALTGNGIINIINTNDGKILKSYNLLSSDSNEILKEGLLDNEGEIIKLNDDSFGVYLNLQSYKDNKFEQYSKLFLFSIG